MVCSEPAGVASGYGGVWPSVLGSGSVLDLEAEPPQVARTGKSCASARVDVWTYRKPAVTRGLAAAGMTTSDSGFGAPVDVGKGPPFAETPLVILGIVSVAAAAVVAVPCGTATSRGLLSATLAADLTPERKRVGRCGSVAEAGCLCLDTSAASPFGGITRSRRWKQVYWISTPARVQPEGRPRSRETLPDDMPAEKGPACNRLPVPSSTPDEKYVAFSAHPARDSCRPRPIRKSIGQVCPA